MGNPPSRRDVLRSVGVAGFSTALAGCSSLGGADGISLGDIVLLHNSERSHRVRVELERNGESILGKTVSLNGIEKRILRSRWSVEPANYTLHTAISGPISDGNNGLNLFESEFGSEDDRSDEYDCSVIHIRFDTPPDPSIFDISTATPTPDGFGSCPTSRTTK